jgi:hypothetical protein
LSQAGVEYGISRAGVDEVRLEQMVEKGEKGKKGSEYVLADDPVTDRRKAGIS